MQINTIRAVKWIIKTLLAGCFALLAMTAFCLLYYNFSIHYPNISSATDYTLSPDTFYSQCSEGISHGKTNNEGFINAFDYEAGMEINTLMMGSSHMEAVNVSLAESTASILNSLFQDKTFYNIGVSGHTFLTCCSNFKAALDNYNPSEYVIIETSRLDFSTDELNSVLDGTLLELADHSDGILGFLSRNQFLRLTYHQLQGFMGQVSKENDNIAISNQFQEDNRASLNNLLSYIAGIALENNVKIIIFYHPTTQINSDGNLLLPNDLEDRAEFSSLCSENGIIFLDMTGRFKHEYEINHVLPHGFCNTSIGSGHLNKYGHKMIAGELYKIIESQR